MCIATNNAELRLITQDEYDLVMEYRKSVLMKELQVQKFHKKGIETCIVCDRDLDYSLCKIISCEGGALMVEVYCKGTHAPYKVSFTPYSKLD